MSTQTVRFGDVVKKVNSKVDPIADGVERYVAGEHMDTDEPRIQRFGVVGDGYLGPAFHMRFEPGHILYGSRRTYLRKVAMADFPGVCANTTFVLEPSTRELDPYFLLYVMSTERFHQNSISLSKGSTNPYINFSDLASYEFELPSLAEQSRIVELISAIDTHIQKLESFEQTCRVARFVAIAERSRRLVGLGRAELVPLGDIVSFHGGLTPSMNEPRYWSKGSIPWITSGDIQGLSLDSSHKKVTSAAVAEASLKVFGSGAVVVVVRSGILAHTLPIAQLPFDATVNQDLKVLVPKDSSITDDYLFCALSALSQQVLMQCRKSGTTVQSISVDALKKFEIICPVDAGEQEELVASDLCYRTVVDNLTKSLVETRVLRSSILNSELS